MEFVKVVNSEAPSQSDEADFHTYRWQGGGWMEPNLRPRKVEDLGYCLSLSASDQQKLAPGHY